MKLTNWGVILLAGLVAAGCSRSNTALNVYNGDRDGLKVDRSNTRTVSNPNAVLIGRWKGRIELPKASKDDPAAAMAEAMVGALASSIELSFDEADGFKLSLMGLPMGGTYEFDGKNLTLHPKTFMGMSESEINSMVPKGEKGPKDFTKPMEGSISGDNTTIRLDSGNPKDGVMVFEKAKPAEPKKVDKPTVKGIEEGLVGTYKGDASSIDKSKLSQEQRNMQTIITGMIENASLVLHADNSFTMNLMVEMEGSWIATGGKLQLTPTKIFGITPSNGASVRSEIFDLWVKDNGQTLELMPRASGEPTFAFRRGQVQ